MYAYNILKSILLPRHRVVLVVLLVFFVSLLSLLNKHVMSRGLVGRSGTGVSIVISTYRRADMLKMFIPIYLTVPIVHEVLISDDIDSGDADELRKWLPASGLSLDDQSKVSIYSNTGVRLGSFRNKVRGISLAKQDWVAIIDSDNFASPEHYWAPLVKFWESTYGSAPPPPGSSAEKRSFHPGHFCRTRVLLEPCEIVYNHTDVVSKCSRDGTPLPEGSPIDPLASVGLDCWNNAVHTGTGSIFVSHSHFIIQ